MTLIGGRPRQLRVDVDPARLAAYELDPLAVQRAIAATKSQRAATGPVAAAQITALEAGSRLNTADELARGRQRSSGRPVSRRRPGRWSSTATPSHAYVTYQSRESGAHPAVTIAVAKRKGTNAIDVAHRVAQKLDTLRARWCPPTCT